MIECYVPKFLHAISRIMKRKKADKPTVYTTSLATTFSSAELANTSIYYNQSAAHTADETCESFQESLS